MSTNENVPSSSETAITDPLTNRSTVSKDKPIVIGLYGVPGCGKTFLLNQLKGVLKSEHFAFYEGSEVIANFVPGGLEGFKALDHHSKVHWRQQAIETIGNECAGYGKVGLVTGHFMFWAEGKECGEKVHTQNDMDTYTHLLYLEVAGERIIEYRQNDLSRVRDPVSTNHIAQWQQTEKQQLRDLCRQHDILFLPLHPHDQSTLLNQVTALVHNFRNHTEKDNLSRAKSQLDEAVVACQGKLETIMFLDADRTLAAEDASNLFWDRAKFFSSQSGGSSWLFAEGDPLKNLFSGPLGYSHTAFRQAVLLYEEVTDEQKFEEWCGVVEVQVNIYPEMVSLLRKVAETEHVGAVVVTCGLRRVWEKVLERHGLSHVEVIGGGNLADNLIVTAGIKAALVARSQTTHQLFAWAFGDSPLDLEMLKRADQAIVVVGKESARSKTMNEALINAIDNESFQGRQVVLPNSAKPRLDTTKLPLVQLSDQELIDSIFARRGLHSVIQVLHATDRSAAKLLMTPMRDATISGPALRDSHRRVGWYLATEFLTDVIGLEEHPIPHVQGHSISGHRLFHEKQISIIALMRGGEPMALGVNDVLPLAMFVHANSPEDLMLHHLEGQKSVILVDSVMNSGKTVVDFVQRIRKLYADIRIVVVAGVAQAQSISEGSLLAMALGRANISVVALRLSDNKFTGTGITDTGNRLFNTTHLA